MAERALNTTPEGAARPWLQRKSALRIGAPDDAYEREADRAADAVASGRSLASPGLSLSRIPVTQVQREEAAKPQSEEEKYKGAAEKLGEAFLETEVGKKLKEKAEQDPLVKGAKEAGESFIGTLPGKIITGAAAAGAVAALAATHKALPAQIPEIPLDKITPGLKVKITYEGPVDNPTKAMITFSYTEQPGGGKKPAKTKTELQREENARMALELARFRAGLRYKPGTPEAKQQEEEEAAWKRAAFSGVGKLPDFGGVKTFPGLAQPPSALSMRFPAPSYGFKPKHFSLLDEELKLKPMSETSDAQEQEKKKKEEGAPVQRKAANHDAPATAPASVREVVASSGRPLDASTRGLMEARFGHDFSRVRIHLDTRAAASARSVAAAAYTVGEHIAFDTGWYTPSTPRGARLLAHELAHVIQQSRAPAGSGTPGAYHERAASQAADAVAAGRSNVQVQGAAGPGLMRQDPTEASKGLARPPMPRMKAMTPEDAYNKLLATRGFDQAISVSELDATEQRLKDMEEQLKKAPDEKLRKEYNALKTRYNISSPKGAGGLAGTGYNTYAIVQVIDKDGYIIAVADGKYTGSGPHAEEIALDKIRANLGSDTKFPGARIDVIGDRAVCSEKCKPALVKFATDYDLDKVDGHVFRRPKVLGTGLAAEKYTARSATSKAATGLVPVRQTENLFMRAAPPTPVGGGGGLRSTVSTTARAGSEGLEARPSLRPGATAVTGERIEVPGPRLKTAVGGALLSVGAGFALGILQEEFKEKMLKDMEALPKPKIDKRSAREYFGDPNTAKAMDLIDVLNKNLTPFGKEMQNHHLKLVAQANLEVIGLALMSDKSPDQIENKLALLDSLQDEVRAYEEQLFVVLDNLDALLDQEAKAMETKKAADDLHALLNNPIVFHEVIERGILSVEQWSRIDSNLLHLSVSIKMTFEDAHKLRDQVRQELDETSELASQLNKIWWSEFGHQLMLHLQQKEAERRRKAQTSAVKRYGAPIELSPMPFWNADQLGMWYHWRTRESELLREIGGLDEDMKSAEQGKQAALREKRDSTAAELARVRKQMMDILGAGGKP